MSKRVFGCVFVREREWKESGHEPELEKAKEEKGGRCEREKEAHSKPAIDIKEWYFADEHARRRSSRVVGVGKGTSRLMCTSRACSLCVCGSPESANMPLTDTKGEWREEREKGVR